MIFRYEDEAPPTFSEKDNQLMQEYYQKVRLICEAYDTLACKLS